MKKPKLLIKVDRNMSGKVYFGNKWHKDIAKLDLHGEPLDYTLTITQYKRNKNGGCYVENNQIAQKTKTIHICRKQGEKE